MIQSPTLIHCIIVDKYDFNITLCFITCELTDHMFRVAATRQIGQSLFRWQTCERGLPYEKFCGSWQWPCPKLVTWWCWVSVMWHICCWCGCVAGWISLCLCCGVLVSDACLYVRVVVLCCTQSLVTVGMAQADGDSHQYGVSAVTATQDHFHHHQHQQQHLATPFFALNQCLSTIINLHLPSSFLAATSEASQPASQPHQPTEVWPSDCHHHQAGLSPKIALISFI